MNMTLFKDKSIKDDEVDILSSMMSDLMSSRKPQSTSFKPKSIILGSVTTAKDNILSPNSATVRPFNSENKENYNTGNTKGKYKIVYDKPYTGIKKRNTPVDEIQNYVIDIESIINEKDVRTTLMIKNIPPHITQGEIVDKINLNHGDNYNFFYLPIDFTTKGNAGYAFINFKSPKMIINFFLEFNYKPWGFKNSNKIAYVSYARIQGFRSISSHFKKSTIMKQVDGKVKPIIID
jgi:hypothetical protein